MVNYGNETSLDFISPESGPSYITNKVTYLQLPVALRVNIYKWKTLVPFVQGGFYVAKSLSGSQQGWYYASGLGRDGFYSINNKARFTNNNEREDGTFNVSPYDFGAQISTGFDWHQFQLNIQYLRGLVDATPNNSFGPYRNESFSVSLAYMFNLAKALQ